MYSFFVMSVNTCLPFDITYIIFFSVLRESDADAVYRPSDNSGDDNVQGMYEIIAFQNPPQ